MRTDVLRNTTFCDAVQLSPRHPVPPPALRPTLRPALRQPRTTRSAGAQVRVFFYRPLPFVYSFVHSSEHRLKVRCAFANRSRLLDARELRYLFSTNARRCKRIVVLVLAASRLKDGTKFTGTRVRRISVRRRSFFLD